MRGKCRLCGKEDALRESHLVPRFVINWMKESGGKYLRAVMEPNKRRQDGPKYRWLCESCEQRFSVRENYFSSKLFHPYLSGSATSFPYDERLYYCCISLLWRSVLGTMEHADFAKHKFYPLVSRAEVDWREYLLGKKPKPDFDSVDLFLSDIITGPASPAPRFNSYFARAIDATMGSSQTTCFIYIKFSRFLLFGHLTPADRTKWINTQIEPTGGKIQLPQELNDGEYGDFIRSRAEEAQRQYQSRVSTKTKDVISKHYAEEFDRLASSDLMRVQSADFSLPVVPPSEILKRKVGRNELCPCGSGKKFKYCHGI